MLQTKCMKRNHSILEKSSHPSALKQYYRKFKFPLSYSNKWHTIKQATLKIDSVSYFESFQVYRSLYYITTLKIINWKYQKKKKVKYPINNTRLNIWSTPECSSAYLIICSLHTRQSYFLLWFCKRNLFYLWVIFCFY